MKVIVLITLLISLDFWSEAQDSAKIKLIDSLSTSWAQKAKNNQLQIVNQNLLLEGNRIQPIKFLSESDSLRIIWEENAKENITIYFLENKKLLLARMFRDGDFESPSMEVYFIGSDAFKKKNGKFEKVNEQVLSAKISSYIELLEKSK